MRPDGLEAQVRWANGCVQRMQEFEQVLRSSLSLRSQLGVYRRLCIPYEMPCADKQFSICKPEFLEGENRGKIIHALNPTYFTFGKVGAEHGIKRVNVPNDVFWGAGARANYIHGPNSGGKSVYLDTIALNVHLAMAGLFCFAKECQLTFPGELFSCRDTGDDWDAGHLETTARKVRYMLKRVTRADLVFIDETGTGTEPEAERIVAKGLTDGLLQAKIPFFAVTHDRGSWVDHRQDVVVLRVADQKDVPRKYKVWPGVAPAGYGLAFAKQMGIDPVSISHMLRNKK